MSRLAQSVQRAVKELKTNKILLRKKIRRQRMDSDDDAADVTSPEEVAGGVPAPAEATGVSEETAPTMAKRKRTTTKTAGPARAAKKALNGSGEFLNLKVPAATKSALRKRAKADSDTLNGVATAALNKFLGL